MNYKKLTAVPRTAVEITGIEGCNSFFSFFKDGTFGLVYTSEMDELALKKKRIEVKPLENMTDKYYGNYDYKNVIIDPKDGQYFWKKEWLKDFREEVDWSKVPVNTPVAVKKPSGKWEVQHFKKYKGECDLIEVWQDGKTSYTTNSTDEYHVDNVELISDEFKGGL